MYSGRYWSDGNFIEIRKTIPEIIPSLLIEINEAIRVGCHGDLAKRGLEELGLTDGIVLMSESEQNLGKKFENQTGMSKKE